MTSIVDQIRLDPSTVQRRQDYQKWRRYYDGDHAIRHDRRYRAIPAAERNYTALVVDTMADYLGEPRVSFGDDNEAQQLEAFVTQVWQQNRGPELDYETEIATSVDGDGAYKVTHDETRQQVVVVGVDPATLYVLTRPDEPLTVEAVAQQYQLHQRDFPLVFGSRIVPLAEQGTITEVWTHDTWEIWLDGQLQQQQPNPYGVIPYVVFPNWRSHRGRFWGTSDIQRIATIQDQLNLTLADWDLIMTLAGSIVVLENVDGGNLAVQPGAVWELPEASRAYVLDVLSGASAESRERYSIAIQQQLHDIARVPRVALGEIGAQLSGRALQIALEPLSRAVGRKRLSRAYAYARRAELILDIAARFEQGPQRGPRHATISWTDVIPSDRQGDLDNALREFALGRSRASILADIGVDDPNSELAARAVEDQQLAPAPTPTLESTPDE